MSEDVVEAVRTFMRSEFPRHAKALATISPSESLVDRGILDSVGLLSVVIFLEAKWGIKVSPDDYSPDQFATLDQMREYVERRRG